MLWAFACRMAVDFACRRLWALFVEGCGLCLWEGCGLLLVERLWALLVERLWTLLVLESFLEGFGMLESEYSLLEKRKQPARIEKATSRNRL